MSSRKPVFSTGADPGVSERKTSEPVCTWFPQGTEPEATQSEAEAVECAMWEGTPLPDELACNCENGHPHHRPGYREMPIVNAAREYPAGSSTFLETNFQEAFWRALEDDGISSEVRVIDFQTYTLTFRLQGKCSWIPKLGSQAPLPHLWQHRDVSYPILDAELRHEGSAFLRMNLNPPQASDHLEPEVDCYKAPRIARLCLFKSSFATDASLEVIADFKCLPPAIPELTIGLYTKSVLEASGPIETSEHEPFYGEDLRRQIQGFVLDKTNPNARIVELGIYCNTASYAGSPRGVLDLYGLVIRPRIEPKYTCSLMEPELYHRTSGKNKEQRLRWAWRGSKDKWPVGLPWSKTTGPFSFFTIMMEGKVLGQAHCLEYPLRPHDWLRKGKSIFRFTVQGHLFGGGAVFSSLVAEYSEGEGGLQGIFA